jgi:uncharacterized protein
MTGSAVYEGWIRHRRFRPIEHSFRYRLFLPYLDLEELPELLDPYPLWSARGAAPARFDRADFMGDPQRPLAECARDEVEAATGSRPLGPVRMLANLRYLGHVFNPVSFYYCFDEPDERVEAVVADVNSIPWGERRAYVLARGGGGGRVLRDRMAKAMHVSPLMGMDHTYSFRAAEPGPTLSVHIASDDVFDATLSLRRRELSRPLLARMLLRYPAMSLQVVAKIYAQALRLRVKGASWFPHPEGREPRGFISP